MATPRPDGAIEPEEQSEAPIPSGVRLRDAFMLRGIEDVAKSPTEAVLIVGQGALGAARRIHRLTHAGARAPFIHVDCGWLPGRDGSRLLFGTEDGTAIERGFVERANGGTLFLDDISELPGDEQARLAEVIETMTLLRESGIGPVPVRLRIVASLTDTEEHALTTGRLRRELHARLTVLPVVLR